MVYFEDIPWHLRTVDNKYNKWIAYVWAFFTDLSPYIKLDFKGKQHYVSARNANNPYSIKIAFEI